MNRGSSVKVVGRTHDHENCQQHQGIQQCNKHQRGYSKRDFSANMLR